MPSSGGTGRVTVTTTPECAWAVSENVSWISQLSPASGQGSGEFGFQTAANTAQTPRRGDVIVGGVTIQIEQTAASCPFQLGSTAAAIAAAGGPQSVTVTTPGGCAWTAVSLASWITVTSGASGNGSGTVNFTVAPNTGPERTGTLTIAGQSFTVVQNAAAPFCTFSIAPTSQSIGAGGGSGTSSVTTGAGCAWTASSNAPWMTITAGAAGAGNGGVSFTIAANSAPARQGTLTIAGKTFTVNQASGCAYSVSPTSQSVGAGGGNGSATVTTGSQCPWSIVSNDPWISFNGSANRTGAGNVNFSSAANTGPARQGTLTIAGQTFTISQAAGCTIAINPTSRTIGAGGGTGTVNVTAPAGCTWTAVSNASWITIVTGTGGSGNGTVLYLVAIKPPTPSGNRVGTMTIGGKTFTVTQTP